MGEYYILFGTKNSTMYYITNTNPILWSPDKFAAKMYTNKYTAEFAVLRDWPNFKYISDCIDNGLIDTLYVAKLDKNYLEIEKEKLL